MTIAQPIRHQYIKPLIAGGLMFSLIGLLLDINGIKTILSNPVAFASSPLKGQAVESLAKACESEITETARLSRDQLLELLSVPERDSKSRVRQIIQAPYCTLSPLKIRAGAEAIREAYPLEFDPDTTLVILYEDDEYAGYRFKH